MAGRWLLKTEPEEWSWEHQQANGGVSQWDGVRNAQAQKNLRSMANGDLCFFYHSGAKAKEIVGIARVCKTFYPDPSDPASKYGMIDIEAVSKLVSPLPLSRLKQEDGLNSFIMFRQPRLSVVPVGSLEWELMCELAGEFDPPLPIRYDPARLKGNDGEAKAAGFLSEDNGKQELEVSDGKTRFTGEKEKIHHSEGNNGLRAISSEQPVRPCNEEARVSASVRARPRGESAIAWSSVSSSRVKPVGAVVTVEYLNFGGKSRVAAIERAVGQDWSEDGASGGMCSDALEDIQTTKLAPDAKRVYCRRKRKPWQLEHNAETPRYPDDLQFDAEQVQQESRGPVQTL